MTLWKKMLDFDIEAARNRRFANKRVYWAVGTIWIASTLQAVAPSRDSAIQWMAFGLAVVGAVFLLSWSLNPSREERLREQAHLGAMISLALVLGGSLAWSMLPGDRGFLVRSAPLLFASAAASIGAIAAWLLRR